jgi:Zn-dependent peptidase ImmA (M78 family)/transcriptional regulator with XRE-family HTH domain
VSPSDIEAADGNDAAAVGKRVATARRRRSLTGVQLGALVGLNKDQISKVESGRRRVSVRELPKFARALGVAMGDLLGEPSRPRLAMAHRLAAGVDEAPAATRRRALQLLEVEDLLSQRAAAPTAAPSEAGSRVLDYASAQLADRPRNKAEAQRQGRRLAECVRTELALGGHEIGDLAGLIEREFGVDVAVSPLGQDADGLCVHDHNMALIVASSDFSDGHVRFTLAHELGHHILGDPRDIIDERERDMFSDDVVERRVNAFAAHLLMPATGVRDTVAWTGDGVVNERVLVALMERFGVSLSALVGQLIELRLVPFDDGPQLRRIGVTDLVARHRDVAPSAAATTVRRTVRAPERLLRTAIRAAQSELLGLSPVAALLERDDDDALWRDIMESDLAAPSATSALSR